MAILVSPKIPFLEYILRFAVSPSLIYHLRYTSHYTNKGLVQRATHAVGSGGFVGEGVNALLGADITHAGYHGIREVEFLCSEGKCTSVLVQAVRLHSYEKAS